MIVDDGVAFAELIASLQSSGVSDEHIRSVLVSCFVALLPPNERDSVMREGVLHVRLAVAGW